MKFLILFLFIPFIYFSQINLSKFTGTISDSSLKLMLQKGDTLRSAFITTDRLFVYNPPKDTLQVIMLCCHGTVGYFKEKDISFNARRTLFWMWGYVCYSSGKAVYLDKQKKSYCILITKIFSLRMKMIRII